MHCPSCGRPMRLTDSTYWEEQEYRCDKCNIDGVDTPQGQKFFRDGKELDPITLKPIT